MLDWWLAKPSLEILLGYKDSEFMIYQVMNANLRQDFGS